MSAEARPALDRHHVVMTGEPDGCAYRNIEDARIGGFIEAVYNAERLQSALGYRRPAEFEVTLPPFGAVRARPQTAMIATTCP